MGMEGGPGRQMIDQGDLDEITFIDPDCRTRELTVICPRRNGEFQVAVPTRSVRPLT